MKNELKFEIAYRKQLLKRLEAPFNTLMRQREKESATAMARIQTLSEFESVEDAHEAYGYGSITFEEYEAVRDSFEKNELKLNEQSVVGAALDELTDYMNRLKREIKDLEWEGLSDDEKAQIEKSNADWKAAHNKRRGNSDEQD